MKTCVTCKFATTTADNRGVSYCGHDDAVVSINVVTGDRSIASCEEMRRISKCGVDAILHEAKFTSPSVRFVDRLKEWFVS